MASLKPNHQPKRQPYKDRDALLAFLLNDSATDQSLADLLDLAAAHLRTKATKKGQMIDPVAEKEAA